MNRLLGRGVLVRGAVILALLLVALFALPAWFDADVLAYLLEVDETDAENLLAQITAFSFVQPR